MPPSSLGRVEPAPGEPRIKGSGIQPFLAWYNAQWGHPRLTAVVEALSPEARACFDPRDEHLGVLASQWFPARAIHALLDRMMAEHTPDERQRFARDGAKAIIEQTLTGVYRWLFQLMMTPDRYGRSAQRLFSRYYEPGTMTKTALGDAGHLSIVRDWAGHHPLLCDFLIHTAQYVYSELGCRNVVVRRTACLAEQADHCRFEITWTP